MVGIVHHVRSYHCGEAVYSTYSALSIQTETVNELVSVVFKLLMKVFRFGLCKVCINRNCGAGGRESTKQVCVYF